MNTKALHHLSRDPSADWTAIVIFSALVAVIGIILGVMAYLSVDSAAARPVAAPPAGARTIDVKALGSVLNQLDRQTAERAAMSQGWNGPGDPSL